MIIKRLDLSQYPQCGADVWTDRHENVFWRKALIPNAAPGGRPALEIEHIGTRDTAAEYYNLNYRFDVPQVLSGAVRYLRIRLKLLSPILWADQAGGRFGMKFICIGQDGAFDTNRAIVNLRSNLTTGDLHDPANVMIRCERNVGIGPSRVDQRRLPIDRWMDLQFRIRSGANGGIDIYLDNDDEARPTASSPGTQQWPVDGWNVVRLGWYGESLGTQGHAAYQIAAFEYADTFDPAWHSGVIVPPVDPPPPPPPVDPPPPPPPVVTNYRVTTDTRTTVDVIDGQPQNPASSVLSTTVVSL